MLLAPCRGTTRCMSSGPTIALLGISGSIRRQSTSTAILEALRNRVNERGKARMELFALDRIPPYNGDLDGAQPPPPVSDLKKAIEASGGLVICSPEYNHGMSGVLKNALDWASRPHSNSPLKGKPVLIMTSSPGATGGVRAQVQVRETLVSTYSRVVITPEIVIPHVFEKLVGGEFADESSLSFAEGGIDALLREALSPGP
jgi:chromate reductase